MVDTFSTGVPISSGYAPDAPRFGTVIEANLNRTFDPIISSAERKFKFGSKQDPKYDFKKYAVGQYAEFSAEFASQPNDQAAVNLRQQIDRSNANRQTLAMATTAQLIGSALFDPINYIGLPFGGPALTVGRAALRTSVSVGAVEIAREGAILATDPTARYEEAALNVGSSMLFGAAIGGLVSAPAVGRAQAFERVSKFVGEYTTLQRANENAANISPEMFMSRISRDQRPFAAMDDATLQSDLLARVGEADDLKARAGNDEGLQDLRDRAAEIERGAGELRQELGLRYIEDSGFKMDDPYGIPANWFTDSVFYKAITTPMKRALQSKYPTTVKKAFFDLAHDMSLGINQNSLGIRSEPSVFLKTAVSHGNMAKMESSLKDLYGQVQQNPMAFDDWIASASRKRLLADPNMSEAELKASSVLEDYFGRDVTGKLEEQGLISTPRGRENRIRIINEEIEGLNARRDGASEREIAIIDSRVTALKKDGDMMTRMAMGDYDKLAQYETLIVDIAQWNKTWMANTIKKIDDGLVADRVTLSNLQKVFDERGLTPKQSKLYNDLKARVQNGDDRIANFNNLTDKINAAKTADDVLGIRQELDMTEKMSDAMTDLSKAIGELKTRIDNVTSAADKSPADAAAEPFFPRFYNLDKIRQNKEAFTKIIMEEFSKKPYVYEYDPVKGDYVRKELSSDPAMVRARAERTVNNILSEGDPVDAGDVVAGLGRSKHFRHRKLDIPTSAIIDYIELNPVSVLNSYSARVNPRSLFQEKFGKDYFGVATEMELDMIRAGASEADINKMRVDFDSLYRRIVSNVLDRPDAINQKIAFGLKTFASFAFMGGSGVASVPDFGRIIAQYELAPMMKGIQSMADMNTVKMSGEETRISGSALEITMGNYRLDASISNNFVAPKLLNSAQNAFYILNLLTPITIAYKRLSGLMMGHTIIDSSIKFTNGTINDFDKMILLKHGIDEDLAARLSKMPWQRNKEGLILPNTEQWADHIEIPEIDSKRITMIEANEDGTPVGKTDKNGNYVGAYYNRKTNTLYLDRDFVEGPMFQRKAWLKPRTEGVDPLPDIFKTPKQWSNFVILHEVNHSRFGIDDVEFDVPPPAKDFTRIYRFGVKNPERAKVADWVAESETYQDMLKSTGRWYEDNLDAAMWYMKENPEGEVVYVDIPTKDLESYRVSNIVMTEDGLNPKKFSARPETELFVSREIADAAQSFSKLRTAGYENKINQLAMADFKAAKTISEDDVLRFRVALNSGITNTVINGTPADRPIMADGVVHIPMSVASKFGLKEDKFLKGYARIENGFIAMPFQFYNFLFGTLNKTLGAMAHGEVKNRALGAATMIGLSYMALKMRTNEATWDNMSYQDKIARSIDNSGLLPFYSDLFYRTMHSTIALGGPNITGGFLQPKFNQQVNPMDVVTDIAGAGPSWAANVAEGIFKVTTGDYGEGASDVLRMMPMANWWFWKGEVSELAQALRQ
jgi:hypothetical protein